MIRISFLILFISFIPNQNAVSQSNSIKALIDSATSRGGTFVLRQPIKKCYLDKLEVHLYNETIQGYGYEKVDTLLLLQLIENSKLIDTTNWTDDELPNAFLLDNSVTTIDYNNISAKFYPLDSQKGISILEKIKEFNIQTSSERRVWQYSRPILDHTKTYAAICFIRPGGGGIQLFHLSKNKWQDKGFLKNWRN